MSLYVSSVQGLLEILFAKMAMNSLDAVVPRAEGGCKNPMSLLARIYFHNVGLWFLHPLLL